MRLKLVSTSVAVVVRYAGSGYAQAYCAMVSLGWPKKVLRAVRVMGANPENVPVALSQDHVKSGSRLALNDPAEAVPSSSSRRNAKETMWTKRPGWRNKYTGRKFETDGKKRKKNGMLLFLSTLPSTQGMLDVSMPWYPPHGDGVVVSVVTNLLMQISIYTFSMRRSLAPTWLSSVSKSSGPVRFVSIARGCSSALLDI